MAISNTTSYNINAKDFNDLTEDMNKVRTMEDIFMAPTVVVTYGPYEILVGKFSSMIPFFNKVFMNFFK